MELLATNSYQPQGWRFEHASIALPLAGKPCGRLVLSG
jgi:hypothetical protein